MLLRFRASSCCAALVRTPTATRCVDSLDGAVFECPEMLNLTPGLMFLVSKGGLVMTVDLSSDAFPKRDCDDN